MTRTAPPAGTPARPRSTRPSRASPAATPTPNRPRSPSARCAKSSAAASNAPSAAWIWNFADEHLPGAVQIVDLFHAKEHLFDAAKAIYGPTSDLAAQWGKARRDELDRHGAGPVIDELRRHADRCEAARRELDHFTANRERMDYPAFRAKGLCVTTGVVEGACKSVVGSRLKRGGMHWTVNGANAIIALRCAIDSKRFDGYWKRQACKS